MLQRTSLKGTEELFYTEGFQAGGQYKVAGDTARGHPSMATGVTNAKMATAERWRVHKRLSSID
jgi:hypothetical protein